MSRTWRSDDTEKWIYGFGNGSDGDLTISSDTTETVIDSSCSGTAGSTSLSATNASFAVGQFIIIHQTRGTGVGQWELAKISAYTAGTITTDKNLQFTYTDSGASQAQVRVQKQHNNVTINSGVTYTAKAWGGNVGGLIGWFAKGKTTVNGTITAASKGYLAGQGAHAGSRHGRSAEGSVGSGQSETTSANGSGGGGGGPNTDTNDGGGGGGGGSHATAGTAGTTKNNGAGGSAATTTTGNAGLTLMTFGGGGGQGGADDSGSSGLGGYGGGIVLVISKNIEVTGSITTRGENGTTTSSSNGGHGGGAGGSVLLKGQTLTLGSALVASAGGTGSVDASTGGNAGVGRNHVDYSKSLSGTTSPTLDSRQDSSLRTIYKGSVALFGFLAT